MFLSTNWIFHGLKLLSQITSLLITDFWYFYWQETCWHQCNYFHLNIYLSWIAFLNNNSNNKSLFQTDVKTFRCTVTYAKQQSALESGTVLANIYLLKVRNIRTRREICSKLTIRTMVSLLLTFKILHNLF